MDLLDELDRLTRTLDREGIDYALCGGLALAVYAKPRATLDIDIMVDPDLLSETRKVARELGFTLTSAPMNFMEGAVTIHRLTKIDAESGEHVVLDLLLVSQETKKAWDDRLTVEWKGRPLKVVSPQGLIALKTLRGSGQDKDDIEYLRSLEHED